MIENTAIKIAVIAEDPEIKDYTVQLLAGEDYTVLPFSSQKEALRALEKETVNLIISEFQSTNINGLQLCKILRNNFLYNLTPMFFLIPDAEPLNAARLTYAGADDYIKVSLIREELFLKVKLNLARVSRHQDINKITRLPGLEHLLKELQVMTNLRELFAVCEVAVRNFEAFNYCYGFEKGNEVIRFIAALIVRALREFGHSPDFLSHLYATRFIFTTYPDSVDTIVNKILADFDSQIGAFYATSDRNQGYLLVKNRRQEIVKAPLMTMHIGVLINEYFPVFTPARIIQATNEISALAFQDDTSSYIIEEKKSYPLP